MTVPDIVSQALLEIGVVSPGEPIQAADANFVLVKLNRLIDSWGALKNYIYAEQFLTFTLVPNLQPHTIGIVDNAPTFVVLGNRPTKIVSAQLVINSSNPSYNIPINIRDADWWGSQRVPDIMTTYPTDVYYEPDWPNGSLFFWPIPTTAYPVQLELWTPLIQFMPTGQFSMPPGYWDAIVYTLAESLCPSYEKPVNPALAQLALEKRMAIKSLNSTSPRISTGGDGLPTGGANRNSFDWRTGFSIGTWR